jgi:hypothetical protein
MDPEVFDTLSDPDRDSLFAGQEDFMKEATASGEMVGTRHLPRRR